MEDLISFMEHPHPINHSANTDHTIGNYNRSSSAPKMPEYSVSEISTAIKRCVETNFNKVRIRGEIFGGKRADSGHWYLSLKDENAIISAVIWKSTALHLSFKPEDGLEVIATGKITTFAGKSSYQLVIDQMEVAGTGALLKLLEERKAQFAKEGLFDASHKQNLPYLPNVIGVVSSAGGAVIRDIIHRIRDRFPTPILLWPTPVQGEGASVKIAEAIRGFNNFPLNNLPRPDVIIVARGGGSLEDLWPFNEEEVIRAVYDSQIPIISAVGHETDTMLIDYVADKRAPTPTGAAEFAVPVKAELEIQISNLQNRLTNGSIRYLSELKNQVQGLSRGIPNLTQILNEITQRFDDRVERLSLAFRNILTVKHNEIERCTLKPYFVENIFEKNQENLKNLAYRLDSVSIDSVLKRGFAWIKGSQGQTIYSVTEAQKDSLLEINFHDGHIHLETNLSAQPKPQKKANSKVIKKHETLQADLFDL